MKMQYTYWNSTQLQKKKEILPFATTWMNLSEVSQRETSTAMYYK